MYEYQASLMSIHDGDTVWMHVDLGCRITLDMELRLDGVDAPELRTNAGDLALSWITQWFKDNPAPYTVRTVKDKKEKWGRYLATVICPKTAATLNTDLISSGNAKAYFGGTRA